MRDVNECLNGSFIPLLAYLVQRQRHDNRGWKTKDQIVKRRSEACWQKLPEIWICKKIDKVLKAHPRAL